MVAAAVRVGAAQALSGPAGVTSTATSGTMGSTVKLLVELPVPVVLLTEIGPVVAASGT